jgi:hypothetical protein
MVAVALLVAIGGGVGAVIWAMLQVPDFYETALEHEPDPVVRKAQARRLVVRARQLAEHIEQSDQWSEDFNQEEINSWFAEELGSTYGDVLPEGVEDPRIELVDGGARLGFRYRHDGWSGVVSARLEAWVPEPNHLAIEVDLAHAGLLPIPIDAALEEIIEHLQAEGWDVAWNTRNGRDVILVDLSSKLTPPAVLDALELSPGKLHVRGSRPAGDEPPPAAEPLPQPDQRGAGE